MASHMERSKQMVEKDFSPPDRPLVLLPLPERMVSSGSTYTTVITTHYRTIGQNLLANPISSLCGLREVCRGNHVRLVGRKTGFWREM